MEHLPNSLDSEDGHREFAQTEDYERRLWNWKRAKIVRLLKISSVLHRRFPRQGGTREFVGGFCFSVCSRFVHVCEDAFCRVLADQRLMAILSTVHFLI